MDKNSFNIKMEDIYLPSEKVVTREIEGDLIIVPIENKFADFNDALYSLNSTGKAIWELLDQNMSVESICKKLSQEYSAQPGVIENDIMQILNELLKMDIIIKAP